MQSLSEQLAFMYVPESFTMHNEFFKVERGVHYIYQKGKKVSGKRFFYKPNEVVKQSDQSEMISSFQKKTLNGNKRKPF